MLHHFIFISLFGTPKLDVHRRVSPVPENHVIGSDDRITLLNHFSCQSAVRHCNSISLYQSNIQYSRHHHSIHQAGMFPHARYSKTDSPNQTFNTPTVIHQAGMFPHSRSSKPDKRHSVSNEPKGPPQSRAILTMLRPSWAARGSRVSVPSQHHHLTCVSEHMQNPRSERFATEHVPSVAPPAAVQ